MKKILALILALVLCLSSVALLASCKDPSQGGTEPGPGTATYDVEAAKDYVKSLYTKYLSNNKTNGDFKLVNQVKQGDVVYTVTWTSDNEAVKVVETEGEATVTIDVPEKPAEDVNYTLKATVTAPDGATASLEFKLLVPKFDQDAGFEDYIAAEKGDAVTVEGIVTSITSKSQGGKYNNLYIQDLNGAGGYYIYSIKDGVDPVADLGIKLGMTVSVSGTKDIYNGTHEVKDAVVTVTDTTEKEITFIDLTDKALAAENEEDFDLVNYQGCWVTIKGVVIGGVYADQYYYYWSIGNVDSYTRLALSCGLPEATIDAIKNGHTAHKGYTATVKGIVNVYNGIFYLVPLGEDAFVYGDKLEVTDDQKVADEKADLTVKDKFTTESSLTLPVAGATHEDVTIAWTSSNTSVLTIAADGKVTFVAAGTATLTATITANGVTDTKTFDVTVESTGFNPVKPVAGTAYKLAMFQEMANKIVYMNGEESGYYLATTTDFASAIDFFIEETKDGFYVYTTIAGAKKYLNMEVSADGAHVNAKLQDTAVTVYTYNETIKTMSSMVNGEEYVFGTRNDNTYETVGCNKLSYNPFMVVFVTDAGTPDQGGDDPVTPPVGDDEFTLVKPVVGTGYKFGMFQGNLGEVYYLIGGMNGYYLATSTDAAQALEFFVEETTGGYYIYYMDGTTKTYLNMVVSGTHVNGSYGTTASTVYTWNDTLNTLVAMVDGSEYGFGTYNTFNTMGPSKTSYSDNFFGGFVGTGSGTVTPPVVDPGTPENPEEPGADDPESLTIAQAIAKTKALGSGKRSTEKYIVTGILVSVDNSTYGNLTIRDEKGNTFIIYGTYYPYYTSANRWDKLTADQKPAVGDEVSFYGILYYYNGQKCEMENAAILDGWTHHDCKEFLTDPTCKDPATCTRCGKTYGLTFVHQIVDCECQECGEMIHNYIDGECYDCGAVEVAPTTTISFSSTAQRVSQDSNKQVWRNGVLTLTNNKASSTSAVANYSNPARFYAGSNLVVEAAGIKVIKFTCNSSSYATTLKTSIGTVSGATVTVSGSVVTVTFTNAVNSFTVAKLSAQVRMNSITINP